MKIGNKKSLLLTSLILAIMLVGYISYQKIQRVEAMTTEKNKEIIFDSERYKTITPKMILKKYSKTMNESLPIDVKKFPKIVKPGNYTVTLEINDYLFHKKEVPISVKFKDYTGPVVSLKKKSLEFNKTIKNSELVSCIDKTDGVESDKNIRISGLNTKHLGNEKITIVAYDKTGNKTIYPTTIQVEDKQKPSLDGIKNITLTEKEAKSFDLRSGITSQDVSDGNLTSDIQVFPKNLPTKPGEYTFTYHVCDKSGNTISKLRKITVKKEEINTSKILKKSNNIEDYKQFQDAVDSSIKTVIQPTKKKSMIQFLGITVPFTHSNGADTAPMSGCGTWTGTGAVDDNSPTHFIGHNPGDFSSVMSLSIGDSIQVTDDNGHRKTYVVYEVLNVNDDGTNADNPNDDTWSRVIEAGGERISLQTCISDTVNRIVLAK
ncbi:sortase domain-containing protein [Enterococcus canintestini]|uniref:sortase domain-containing protein n=1 Tax=Enterococcus canintestini TaxID=317010 RepID=UPI0015DAED85|nr:immunoglobulin-like domain-containing protein [Enterococcus canintestini]